MKKILKLAFAVAAVFILSGAGTASAQKLGYINSQELLSTMPEIEEVQQKLEVLGADLETQMEAIYVEYNRKAEDYRKSSSTWTESVRQMREEELDGLGQRLQKFQQDAQTDLNTQQETLMRPVIEKAREAIQTVAKLNGMTAVFDLAAGAVIYYNEETMTNLLPLVQRHLGITPQ